MSNEYVENLIYSVSSGEDDIGDFQPNEVHPRQLEESSSESDPVVAEVIALNVQDEAKPKRKRGRPRKSDSANLPPAKSQRTEEYERIRLQQVPLSNGLNPNEKTNEESRARPGLRPRPEFQYVDDDPYDNSSVKPKGTNKNGRDDDDEEEEEEVSTEGIVESILGHQRWRYNKYRYLVRWTTDEETWEPREHLIAGEGDDVNINEKLLDYWKKHPEILEWKSYFTPEKALEFGLWTVVVPPKKFEGGLVIQKKIYTPCDLFDRYPVPNVLQYRQVIDPFYAPLLPSTVVFMMPC